MKFFRCCNKTREKAIRKSHRAYQANATKILVRHEMVAVLADLWRKAKRSPNVRVNRIIFRLAACCGLRVSEIAQLQMADVRKENARPHRRIRSSAAKGGCPRVVPLWRDGRTLAELRAWRA